MPESPINFERERGKGNEGDDILRLLHRFSTDVYRRLGNVGSANITVISGGGNSGGGGGSSSSDWRSGALSGSAGAVVVSFSSALSSSSYRLFWFQRDSSGILMPMDENLATKSASGFSFTANETITGYYLAILDQ